MPDTVRPVLRLGTSYDVKFSPDCSQLATCGRFVWLWDLATLQKSKPIKSLSHPGSLAFSLDNQYLVVKNTLGEVSLIDTSTGGEVQTIHIRNRDEGSRIKFAKDGYLIDGSWDGKIYLRTVSNLSPVVKVELTKCMVCDVDYYKPDNLSIFAINRKASPLPLSDSSTASIFIGEFTPNSTDYVEIRREWNFLTCVRISGDGRFLAIGHEFSSVELFDWRKQALIATVPMTTPSYIKDICWSVDSKVLLIVTNKEYCFFGVEPFELLRRVVIPYGCAADYSSNNQLIALGSWSSGVLHRVENLDALLCVDTLQRQDK